MLTITDLPVSRALDMQAMSSLRGGGGAPWVFSFAPYQAPRAASAVPSINVYDITNNFTYIDQSVNQFTVLNLSNSGDNSNLTAVLLGSQGAAHGG